MIDLCLLWESNQVILSVMVLQWCPGCPAAACPFPAPGQPGHTRGPGVCRIWALRNHPAPSFTGQGNSFRHGLGKHWNALLSGVTGVPKTPDGARWCGKATGDLQSESAAESFHRHLPKRDELTSDTKSILWCQHQSTGHPASRHIALAITTCHKYPHKSQALPPISTQRSEAFSAFRNF